MQRSLPAGISALILAIGIGGCTEANPSAPSVRIHKSIAVLPSAPPEAPGETNFRRISTSVPEFAGSRYRDGTLVISLTSMSARERMTQFVSEIQSVRAKRGRPINPPQFEIVQYPFADLAKWRSTLRPYAMTTEGIFSIDADELRNKVTFG